MHVKRNRCGEKFVGCQLVGRPLENEFLAGPDRVTLCLTITCVPIGLMKGLWVFCY